MINRHSYVHKSNGELKVSNPDDSLCVSILGKRTDNLKQLFGIVPNPT